MCTGREERPQTDLSDLIDQAINSEVGRQS